MLDLGAPSAPRADLRVIALTLLAAAGLAGLAAAGRLPWLWATIAWAPVLAAAVWMHVARERRRPRSAAADATGAPGEAAPDGAVESHPDPWMAAEGAAGEPVRVSYANRAARAAFRVQSGSALLSTIRHPRVLEALEDSLVRGLPRETDFEQQDKVWRVLTTPLPVQPGGRRRAAMAFRDQTDAAARERAAADFLANASHELRTPLASLTGFIETLRGHAREDSEARDRFLAIMADQADRMSALVEDLLSLSRIELNEHVPPSGSVDLSMATLDVVDSMGQAAEARGVRLEPQVLPRGAAVVCGERDQLVQVIQNLVDNALKYSPSGAAVTLEVIAPVDLHEALETARPGAARLTLLSPAQHDPSGYAAIRVRDQGPGLSREHLPRLTERFYRVAGTAGDGRPGTGLGLAIVRHIVNRHRGGLAVESLTGAGAAFTACVPLRRREEA